MATKKRAAPAPRRRKAAAPPRVQVDETALRAATAGDGKSARIRMSAPVTTPAPLGRAAAAAGEAGDQDQGAPPIAPTAAVADQAREAMERVFSPEISLMIMSTAFGVAAVVTGEPDIYQADDDELEPLAPAMGRQLARIPVVKAIGPDNTELGVLVLGLGYIVTRMLNEHARKRQAENARASATPEERRDEIRAAAATRRPAAPAQRSELEDGTAEAHFGMRV